MIGNEEIGKYVLYPFIFLFLISIIPQMDKENMESEVPDFLTNISVILVEPQSPGNIGSTARAMKTMGLSRSGFYKILARAKERLRRALIKVHP